MIASGYSYRWNARGRKYLTAAERTRFLATVRTHPKPAVQTLALTGCRVSEALATRACDVDLEASDVRIATFKRRRSHGRAVPAPEDWRTVNDRASRTWRPANQSHLAESAGSRRGNRKRLRRTESVAGLNQASPSHVAYTIVPDTNLHPRPTARTRMAL